MKLIFFALIPVILSMSIIPAFSLQPEDIETECREGQILVYKFSSMEYICTSQTGAAMWAKYDIAEIVGSSESVSESEVIEETVEPVEPVEPEIPDERDPMLGIETIETHKGTITLDHDYLTPESAKLLDDELLYLRAVQVYHLALPAVSGAGIFYEQYKVGAAPGDVVYWSDFMNSEIDLLTGNTSVLYFMSLQDLSDGPIVVHMPEGNLQGHADNIYQQVITDWGIVGPNEGKEAYFLFLPPGFDGEIPSVFNGETENYFVFQSDTMQIITMARAFVNAPDKAAAEDLITKVNIFKLSELDNPPKVKFIDVSGESLKLSYPTTDGYWELLHEVYSKETVVRPEDKNLVGLMHTIGIVPGEPFAPDEQTREILDKAAIIANLMARNIAYDSPVKEPYLFWPDKNYELAFMTKNPRYEDERGVTQIEQRMSFMYQAITTAEAMVLEMIGKGSKYVGTYRDSNDEFLKGSNLYHLNIPANVPAENFWSIVVYDAETRSMINNGLQPLPGIRSLESDKLFQSTMMVHTMFTLVQSLLKVMKVIGSKQMKGMDSLSI